MTSQAQIDANRANGAKSRGPKTPARKAISAQNATRHGLRSRASSPMGIPLAIDPPGHDPNLPRTLASLVEHFHPRNDEEMLLVNKMARLHCLVRRLIAMQTETCNRHIAAPTESDLNETNPATAAKLQALRIYDAYTHPECEFSLDLLATYEMRAQRGFDQYADLLNRRSPEKRPEI